ncbi:hybrid-cluster NAD(P)-dependent oxidoreductase [Hansschlegelia plantiphila]|uniref:Hybrid-cluster NAD(P)-dependent oxidoreductase n=1 Tax=Hansschlegelia plantiphila TaxID=374655 RepID=A0A9W6IXR4_9HYPH|nr:hybrid-cluster NAD(P)-dependent oxidoreductase [Hansschlegelia plantiphila]GLK66977.1 hybrid-cluster NAD(P)-dependent oxidoreductase [Hansschlegelia plantiphila]
MDAIVGPMEPAEARLANPRPWDADADDELICRTVREETHDVRTFVFSAKSPRRFAHQPGQFLTFAFEIGGETINRCYTIASAPTTPDTVAITVKRVPGGPVSNWLHDTMKPGSVVRAMGPMGEFTCFRHPAEKYLFLSGGSGVTPMMAMARTFHDLGEARDVAFVHSARTPADIVFRDELELMARHNPDFRFSAICKTDGPAERWPGVRGRLSRPALKLLVPDLRDREVFVCGPAPYMAAVESMLVELGFDMARRHEESFDFDALSAQDTEAAVVAEAELDSRPTVRTYKVEFAKTKRVIECGEDTTVLAAARRAGVRLPSSCSKGLCGTCKSKLVSGTVDMSHGGGIRQREIDAGMALLCCSKPTSDLVVDR